MTLEISQNMKGYEIQDSRYDGMKFRRCGKSGILLSEIALGFWHNFGADADKEKARSIVEYAFDHGITYYDLANNYGPPAGSAESLFGEIMKESMAAHRDEMIIATKAGYAMWPGPYGEWGSRKNLIASLDQSLKRMQLDYVDIFYSHRPDPNTPLEETLQALVDIVHQGKALYVGISNYPTDMAGKAYAFLKEQKVPCLLYQGKYNMLNREPEEGILEQAAGAGAGFVAFSPLAQGLLSDRYLSGIPDGSRMTHSRFLRPEALTPELLDRLNSWNKEASEQGFALSQYALRWILRRPEVTSVIVGVSSIDQLKSNLKAVECE